MSSISCVYKLRMRLNAMSSRSPDGQCLILSSRDGYCTLVVFDDILPAHHTQQHTLQLQTIAHHNSVPLTTSSSASAPHTGTPSSSQNQTAGVKRAAERPLTPAASVDDNLGILPEETGKTGSNSSSGVEVKEKGSGEPPKKKRRVALTRVGDVS